MTTVRIVFPLAALAAALCACAPAPIPPAGSYAEVALVAEDSAAAALLRAALEREEDYFVSSEPRFRVRVFGDVDPARGAGFKHVVVCGALDPATAVGRRIAAIAGPAQRSRVRAGTLHVIARPDYPVAGQLTMAVTAPDGGALRAFLADSAATVAAMVEASARARLAANLLHDVRAADTARWERTHGFHLDVPAMYDAFEAGDPPGVELRRDGPPRVLGVFWRDLAGAPTAAQTDSLFAWRARYVARRYDGDRMDPARVRFDRPGPDGPAGALRMAGYWYNDRHTAAGGYYETYFFHDESTGRLWAVDLVVYAPGREKATLVRELRALAGTFRPL